MKKLSIIIAIFTYLGFQSSHAFEEQGIESQTSVANRTQVKDKGFSMIAPEGWQILENEVGLTLFMQPPKTPDQAYQRSIQVRYGAQPYPIDNHTATQYRDILMANRSKAFSLGSQYTVRDPAITQLKNGLPAIAYYAEFSFDTLAMMEMHFLISSKQGHFLITYTDIAEHFEDDSAGTPFHEAYEAISSIEINSQSSGRFDFIWPILAASIGFVLIFFIWRFYESRQDFHIEDHVDDSDEYPMPTSAQDELAMTREQTLIEASEISAIEDDEEDSWHHEDFDDAV